MIGRTNKTQGLGDFIAAMLHKLGDVFRNISNSTGMKFLGSFAGALDRVAGAIDSDAYTAGNDFLGLSYGSNPDLAAASASPAAAVRTSSSRRAAHSVPAVRAAFEDNAPNADEQTASSARRARDELKPVASIAEAREKRKATRSVSRERGEDNERKPSRIHSAKAVFEKESKRRHEHESHSPATKARHSSFSDSFNYMTSKFGNRVLHGKRAHHDGIDWRARIGTKVHAPEDGIVRFAGWSDGYGKTLIIEHDPHVFSLGAHLNGFRKGIRAGRRVDAGQVVASSGDTGAGPAHFHDEKIVVYRGVAYNVNPKYTVDQLKSPAFRAKAVHEAIETAGSERAVISRVFNTRVAPTLAAHRRREEESRLADAGTSKTRKGTDMATLRPVVEALTPAAA